MSYSFEDWEEAQAELAEKDELARTHFTALVETVSRLEEAEAKIAATQEYGRDRMTKLDSDDCCTNDLWHEHVGEIVEIGLLLATLE